MNPVNIFDYPSPRLPPLAPIPLPPMVELAWAIQYTLWITPLALAGSVAATALHEWDRALFWPRG